MSAADPFKTMSFVADKLTELPFEESPAVRLIVSAEMFICPVPEIDSAMLTDSTPVDVRMFPLNPLRL